MEEIPFKSIALFLLCVALIGLGLLIAGILVLRHFWPKKPVSPPLPQAPLASPPVMAATVALPKCQQCHLPLAPNAPEGLCPACLANVALGSEPAVPGATININPLAEAAPGNRVAPDPAQLAAQFPQLEIIELLGMGGMGMVYKARQPRLDRIVALKILPVESHQHPSFAERFGREAKALAKLNHPGIVNIYDFGQTAQYYYFVMEYVDGMNLRHLLQNQPVEPRQALELVMQICTALQFAHDEGVVHRDIKPENILLNKKGQVKIADFGLAKLLGTAPDTALTMSQAAMGTMNYMAPEQRQNAQGVDHRADIYSLGVVFYEMLTGEVPMGRFEPPSKRVHVDVRLDEVVLRALEREPARRYQQASEVKSNVETITSTTPAAAQTAGAPARVASKQLPPSNAAWIAFFVIEILIALGFSGLLAQIAPALGILWIVAVFLVASYQLNSRKEIHQARECGLWPQPGELPTLEHVRLLAQAGKKQLAIKLYRLTHDVPRANAKAAVEKLASDSPPAHKAEAPPAVASPATPIDSQRTLCGQGKKVRQRWSQMTMRGWFGVFFCLNGLIVAQLMMNPGQQQGGEIWILPIVEFGLGCGLVVWGRAAWREKKLTRWEIRHARERGLWPPLGEGPTLEHVKRMAQVGEGIMAIKLYREIYNVSFKDANTAVKKLPA